MSCCPNQGEVALPVYCLASVQHFNSIVACQQNLCDMLQCGWYAAWIHVDATSGQCGVVDA